MEGAWSCWPKYGTYARWPYELHPEVFITYADGSTSRDSTTAAHTGAINPLVHLDDGTWYEDLLCSDLVKYLLDYDMDGFFAADGLAGLKVRLENGDYSDDMVLQFKKWSGLSVPGDSIPERAAWIWREQRTNWIRFWVQRWAAFYRKLSSTLKNAGKQLASMDPFARGPADSVYDFGFDYKAVAKAGLECLCLQSQEESWGRRWRHPWYVWEPDQAIASASIKAQSPELKLIWSMCTANAPEEFYSVRDIPTTVERQLLSLPLTTFIDRKGRYRRAFDGIQNIFGMDLTALEWRWIRERLDWSFNASIDRTLGCTLVWADSVLQRHIDLGQRWETTTPLVRLALAGLPIRSAVNIENLAEARSEAYILVDPLGIGDDEVARLLSKRATGAGLVVIGKVEHPLLLRELGLSRMETVQGSTWTTTDAWPEELGSGAQDPSSPIAPPRFSSMKQLVDSLPTELERLLAAIVQWACKLQLRASDGQVHGFEASDGSVCAMIENIANLFYIRMNLTTSFPLAAVTHYPIKRPSPIGYIVSKSMTEKGCQVTIPPDGVVPLKLTTLGPRSSPDRTVEI